MNMLTRRLLIAAAASLAFAGSAIAQEKSIVVASTTSTQDSGLFGHILPMFKAKTGIDVKVVAQGTGQALDTARRGDADVVFVHAKPAEEKFLSEGFGVKRYPVMYNDFVLIGPKSDPAGVKGSKDIVAALSAIKAKGADFISRGDKSGTHQAEINLWKVAGVDIAKDKGPWYKEIGQGMGAALNTASASNAYVLADRGTWLSFKNRGELVIAVEGDKRLFNQYGVMLVNPEKHPSVKKDLWPAVHRLAGVVGGTEGHRRLQDQRRAAVLSQRQRFRRVTSVRLSAVLAVFAVMIAPATAEETVLLYAAGSLRGALTEVAKDFEAAGIGKVQAKFGPSGILKDEIAAGAKAEVFASANMEHPQALASEKRSGPVVLFARNRLCALVRPGLDVDSSIAAGPHARPAGEARHLDAESRSVRRLRLGRVSQGREDQSRRLFHIGEEGAATHRRPFQPARAARPLGLRRTHRARRRRYLPHLLHQCAKPRSGKIPRN